ncbi:hypothetical protein Tco_1057229, partial [Tanacetum coccineum]
CKASAGSNMEEVNSDANGNIDNGCDAGNKAVKLKPISFANIINSEQVSTKVNLEHL